MPKILAALICLFLSLVSASCFATNLPLVWQNQSSIKLQIKSTYPTHDVFTLIKPNRLVFDQAESRGSYRELKRWRLKYKNLPGIRAIRVGRKAHRQVRLVIEAQPSYEMTTKRHHQSVELKLARHTHYFYNRLQAAATPIKLKPIYSKHRPKIQKRRKIIVIDPGHGGKDPGATGRQGHHEKNIVLKIAKDLVTYLNQSHRYKAILTRSTDRYIPLRERLRIARRNKANLFISIHADAYRNTRARGSSVFALSQRGATSEAAHWLAKKENASEVMGGVQLNDKSKLLQSVLINLSQTATVRDSLQAGSFILSSLDKVNRLHHRHVEQAAFVVLKSPDIPSLLIETGFLSNKWEERQLASRRKQQQIAWQIYQGINTYFNIFKR